MIVKLAGTVCFAHCPLSPITVVYGLQILSHTYSANGMSNTVPAEALVLEVNNRKHNLGVSTHLDQGTAVYLE